MVNVYLTCHAGLKKQINSCSGMKLLKKANQHAHRQSSGERILIRKTFMVLLGEELLSSLIFFN